MGFLNKAFEEGAEKVPASVAMSVLKGAAGGLLIGGTFVAGYTFRDYSATGLLPWQEGARTEYQLLSEAESLLNQHYLFDLPDSTTLDRGATAGMVAAVGDNFTFYVEPETAEIDSTNLAGVFGGIGVTLITREDGQFEVGEVYRDNPAFEAGMLTGDIIVAVDGTEIVAGDTSIDDLVALIRGDVGDPVTITVARGIEELDIEIIRAEVLLPSVFWRILEEDGRVGYVQITRFTGRAPEELEEAINDLSDDGAEAYILDLRGNGGGLVDSSVDVASVFLDGGLILTEERANRPIERFNASRGGAATEEPLIVLVDSATASASEIVAGALRDRDRAVLVGQQTFGKGSVQLILEMSDGSSLHVTTARWFTPDNTPLDGAGLTPDIVIEIPEGTEQDIVLEAGLDEITSILEAINE